MDWLISANLNKYDIINAFKDLHTIDWRQSAKINPNDIVYIYCGKPIQKIMFKTKVVLSNIDYENSLKNDFAYYLNKDLSNESKNRIFMRLELLESYIDDYFNLNNLLNNGLSSAPQGPLRITETLSIYMKQYTTPNTSLILNNNFSITECSEKSFYLKFWNSFKSYCETKYANKNDLNLYKPSNHNWYDIYFNISRYHIVLRCSKQKEEVSIVFYINNDKELFNRLYDKKSYIQNEYHYELLWNENEIKKACTIFHSKHFSEFNTYNECFDWLINNGINLFKIIHQHVDDVSCVFPDTADTDICIEGAIETVLVNKYERSSIAREKCINHHGCYCHICNLNFEKIYGELGKGFIHVHHIIPLNEINEEYIVNPKTDLIPVCPNCHAMLHRKINGKYVSTEKLKELISK